MSTPGALSGALAASRRGWPVFPVGGPNGPKAPRPGWLWKDRNTTDPVTIRRWFRFTGATAYGIACGPARLVIIDLDVAKDGSGERGESALAALCEARGEPWPVTCTVATPSDGKHLCFRASPDHSITTSAGGLPPLIDVRGSGGYVLGAGSVIPAGEYRVCGSVRALASLPGWLARLITERPPAPVPRSVPGDHAALAAWVAGQPHGNHNNGLYWAACRVVEEGGDPWPLVPAAVQAGHGETRARRTVLSALRRTRGGAP